MPARAPPKSRPSDDPVQSERFLTTAKELEGVESKLSFVRVMDAIVPARSGVKPSAKRKPKG